MNFLNVSIGGSAPFQPSLIDTVTPGVTVALIAGITLFLLNWGREWLTAHLKRKSDAEVLAFSLVNLFDTLISRCADVVDDPLHQDQKTQFWQSTTKTPDVIFPEHVIWSVFPKALQYKIRSMPNKIDVADRNISSLWEYGDGPPEFSDAFEERTWRYSWIGLEACRINDILAKKYGVPILDRGEWNPEARFMREIEKISKRREDEKANTLPQQDWMFSSTTMEELDERHSKLTADLGIAIKNRRPK